jgi:hypothetical protein
MSDDDIEQFANCRNPTGIRSKWQLCKDGDSTLGGDPSRVPCEEREEHVHRVLSC